MKAQNLLSIAAGAALFVACAASVPTDSADYLMEVEQVDIDENTSSPVVILREASGLRRGLPIWIGVTEARSIALGMDRIALPRPNTHDLIENLLQGVEGQLKRVVITELRSNTYFAVLELDVDGRKVIVDSRPSDAIAIALRTATPIYATEEVLAQAAPVDEEGPALNI